MIYSVQYLRAAAATAVVIMHVGYIFGSEWRAWAAGVDLFFLISGFIMWSITAGKSSTPFEFLTQRLIKVVPLYWFFTVALVAATSLSPASFGNFQSTPLQVIMSLLFIPYYGRNGDMEPTLGVGWTLNYEMFFYLVFSISLLIRPRYRAVSILGSLALLTAARLLPFQSAVFGLATSPMLLEFAGGILIAIWYRSGRAIAKGADVLLIVAGIAGIGLSFMAPPDGGFARVAMWGLPAAMILVGSLSYEMNHSEMRRVEWLRALGDASYAIYLSHLIVIGACKYIFSKVGLERWGVPFAQQAFLYSITFFACLMVGAACFYVLDKPSHNFLRQWVSGRLRRSNVKPIPVLSEGA